MYRAAPQQHILNYVSKRERLTTERDSLDAAFRKYRADLDDKISRLRTILKNETERAEKEDKKHSRLFVFEKSLKCTCNIAGRTVKN